MLPLASASVPQQAARSNGALKGGQATKQGHCYRRLRGDGEDGGEGRAGGHCAERVEGEGRRMGIDVCPRKVPLFGER